MGECPLCHRPLVLFAHWRMFCPQCLVSITYGVRTAGYHYEEGCDAPAVRITIVQDFAGLEPPRVFYREGERAGQEMPAYHY